MAKIITNKKTINFELRGDKWKVVVYNPKIYNKKIDKDSRALTDDEEKSIYFKADSITERIVIHEICHAYISYCNLSDAGTLKPEDMEEIFCQMIEKQGEELLNTAKYIYKKISKYKVETVGEIIA